MDLEKTRVFGSFTLTRFKSAIKQIKGKSGMVDCLIIPLKENHLKADDKGNIYVNISGGFSEKMSNATHWIKQSLKKEEYDKLSDEQKKEMPFLGSLTIKENIYQDAPETSADLSNAPDISDLGDDGDDLPF